MVDESPGEPSPGSDEVELVTVIPVSVGDEQQTQNQHARHQADKRPCATIDCRALLLGSGDSRIRHRATTLRELDAAARPIHDGDQGALALSALRVDRVNER